MGTRAVYTFIDGDERHSVYKQWDGYPKWACRFIANALPLTWSLPRFEADDSPPPSWPPTRKRPATSG